MPQPSYTRANMGETDTMAGQKLDSARPPLLRRVRIVRGEAAHDCRLGRSSPVRHGKCQSQMRVDGRPALEVTSTAVLVAVRSDGGAIGAPGVLVAVPRADYHARDLVFGRTGFSIAMILIDEADATARYRNEFRLFAHGVEFDPNAYLASSPLKVDGVWRKGESGHNHPKSSGVFKVLGDGRTLPLFEQERIAIEYLSANREALKALSQHRQVTTFILGLQYHTVLNVNTVGFAMGPSEPLMRHCLDIGILPTFYVTLDRERERAE